MRNEKGEGGCERAWEYGHRLLGGCRHASVGIAELLARSLVGRVGGLWSRSDRTRFPTRFLDLNVNLTFAAFEQLAFSRTISMQETSLQTAEQLLSFVRSPPNSSTSSTASSLQQALQAIQDLAPQSSTSFQAPAPIHNFDLDPFSPLLRQSSSSDSHPPNQSTTSDSALAWLHKSLPDEFKANQVIDILQSGRDDAEIQESLLNVWGFEGIEDIGEAVKRRTEIVEEVKRESEAFTTQPPSKDEPNGGGTSHLSAQSRDYTPGAQLKFATQEEVQAMKQARKMMKREKGKARADGEDYDEPDVEEWLRKREETLAKGPGALVSGKRVS